MRAPDMHNMPILALLTPGNADQHAIATGRIIEYRRRLYELFISLQNAARGIYLRYLSSLIQLHSLFSIMRDTSISTSRDTVIVVK